MTIKTVKPKQSKTAAKSGKPTSCSLMDDAPLFAGLDDFVLLPSPKKLEPAAQKTPVPKKKKTTTQPVRQASSRPSPSRQSPPETATKPILPTANESLLLSVAEMCRLLKISRATLIRMDNAGKLPGKIKLGGSVRFHRETVEAWLQSLLTPPKLSP